MKINIVRSLAIVFIVGLLFFLVLENLRKPRVFILHSYALDYSWVRDINDGIMRIFKKRPYSLRWHYMDTKRHPAEDFKRHAGNTARRLIKNWRPDIIIAIDDTAQEHVAKYFNNDPAINIVFTGVNAETKTYGYDTASNATGMLERVPLKEFKEVFVSLLPKDKRRIVHISDNSESSKYIHQELEAVDWSPLRLVSSSRCDTFAQWKKAILEAHSKGDILLVTHYHTIKEKMTDKMVIPPKKIIDWTQPRLKMPAIGCWGFYVEDGGMMAVAVSPYEQGEEAAKMAVEIIETKRRPKDIPVKTGVQYVVYIREKLVRDINMDLPRMLEAFARATNNYFEEKIVQ
ncbi:MAG TPA: ABC transporter substrate binding protein [Spirochaetota bacterium]|nr:ABC transporter substrate binding protein [Spirochaetota bacterium]HPU89275.1 ABC transporter substrate binding protein [Spirochaetota bacterium]